MDKFDMVRHYYRGMLKSNTPYEVWGLAEHIVSVHMPEQHEWVEVFFSYMPPNMSDKENRSAIGVTKTVKKSGVILVTGRFSHISWSASPTTDGVVVHYAGYPN